MKFQPESPTWQVLNKFLLKERADVLEALVASNCEKETYHLRGEVARIDMILDLPTRLDDWQEQ